MCYICEARGNVGANYKAANREITKAIQVVGKPNTSWGNTHNWTTMPTKRLWSNADLKAYANSQG